MLGNYPDDIVGRGGKVLFTCRGEECGGDPERSSAGGGGQVSLAMYRYPATTAAMKLLVVGHTDNVGGFAFNMDLSQRRAAAVVSALSTRFGISKDRWTPVGVSFASPVASNQTDEGRGRNRRVELVEQTP